MGDVRDVCFSPDGTRIASASHDKMVKLWNVATGQETLTLKVPKGVSLVRIIQSGQHTDCLRARPHGGGVGCDHR